MKRVRPLGRCLFVMLMFAMLVAMTACQKSGPTQITDTRTMPAEPTPPAAPSTPAPGGMPPTSGAMPPTSGAMPASPHHPNVAPLDYAKPEGWDPVAPTSMRICNFAVKADPKAECYVTILKGAAGGVDMNVNRWRAQMGQPELKPEDIAALPKVDMLGQQAPVAEITGAYTGMSGEAVPNYMMLGVVAKLNDQALFVKMVGPESTVKGEKESFLNFCKSLKPKS